MNLEDHVGDVIRKARAMRNVSAAAAAHAAGWTEAELATVEEAGSFSKRPNFAALAEITVLSGSKLESMANGWMPSPRDFDNWRQLRKVSTTERGNQVHCYLAWDEVTREAALFDTGWDAAPAFKLIEENELQLRHLFITHTHHDHIAGLEAVRARFPKVLIHTDAQSAPPQHKNRRNDCIQLGSLRITNRDTPGHAEDGVTYLIGNWPDDAAHVAIVGDAIFACSMGGAPQHGTLAREKVRAQILSLPPDTLICPGHGPLTTVGEEQEYNPFF